MVKKYIKRMSTSWLNATSSSEKLTVSPAVESRHQHCWSEAEKYADDENTRRQLYAAQDVALRWGD